MNKDELIKYLDMVPLTNEGGFINELYRGEMVNGRQTYGTSLYLMTPECCSCMHKLEDDEVWFYHDGSSVEMLLIYDDHSEVVTLGKNYDLGERPHIRVKGGVWQGSHMKYDGEYSLVSTTMTPAYDVKEFTLGKYDELKDKTPYLDLLKLLTQEPKSI